MWPFNNRDDIPEWVTAREKRFKAIEKLVIDNVPDIVCMPLEYEFVYNKPMKVLINKEQELTDRCICNKTYYSLAVQRFAGVGSQVGICLGYYEINERPEKYYNGYNYDRLYVNKNFEYFFQGNELDIWKYKLAEQLPDFFKCCKEDIVQKLEKEKKKKIITKKKCSESVDNTLSIISCLRSKLNKSK